jgi:hypothetical protein
MASASVTVTVTASQLVVDDGLQVADVEEIGGAPPYQTGGSTSL